MVKLAGVILALLIEVFVGIIFTQLWKATSKKMTIQLGSYGFVAAKKLYCLVEPTHLGVLAPIS